MPFKKIPPAYYVWASMKDRCGNPNAKQYADYGGRGIKVCDRWINSYETFYADMGPRTAGHSIDRIDNDLGYEPGNCRWASRKTQQRNQRRAVYVSIAGVRYRAIELADISGQKVDVIVDRAERGLAYEDVIRSDKIYNTDTSHAVAGRKAKAEARTHCKEGHEFTAENTYIRKDGGKQCRKCHAAKMRRYAVERSSRNDS